MGLFDDKDCEDWADLETELEIEERKEKNRLFYERKI